ncbi:MAG: polysaccharide deacetylase [Parcubacteria group bacterium Gr01-1014_33]|nr:MAG: polysaccharide deacetylase [Parcubacteria group bacterium Gr01-1014_33]
MFSPNERYIIVNYHYVRDPDSSLSGIFPCPVDEFRRQIEFLSERYKIVSVEEVVSAAENEEKRSYCALTFDDGLKDQYDNAFPILKKYGARGTFFIIGCVCEGALPAAHALHVLMSSESVSSLVRTFQEVVAAEFPSQKDEYPIPSDHRLTSKRMHEDILTANFKETLMQIPGDLQTAFLGTALSRSQKEPKALNQMLFMKKEEIREIQKSGMAIGSHSYAHAPLYEKQESEVRDDVERAKEILSGICEEISPVFSYPHGRADEMAHKVLQEEGFRYAVTIERRGVRKGDLPYLIPRYDAGDLQDFCGGLRSTV